MVENESPQIIGHLDKIKMHNIHKPFFDEHEKWYQKEVMKTLTSIAKSGRILEVNTRSLYKKKSAETYPSTWIMALAKEMNIPVMINSDAHHPSEISRKFKETATILSKIGYKKLRILYQGKWQDRDFSSKGIEF